MAGFSESTRADILWHTSPTMTHHSSMVQIVELHGAPKFDTKLDFPPVLTISGQWNQGLNFGLEGFW